METLVLGGGNTKGAFQAGVIYALYENGYRPGEIYGTSIGAVNAYLLSRIGHKELYDFWYHIGPRQMYLRYNWRRFFWDGIFDLEPLRGLLGSISRSPEVVAKFSKVDLASGAISYGSDLDSCLASASEPLFMRPINGCMDGGIRDQAPVVGGTNQTVIVNNPIKINPTPAPRPRNILSIVLRSIDTLVHEGFMNDLNNRAEQGHKIYAPEKEVHDRFRFDREGIRQALDLGIKAAHSNKPRLY